MPRKVQWSEGTLMRITDPLATARLYLQLNPNEEENRALRKLLCVIADGSGTLHESESQLFQGELGDLTAALLDANLQGRYSADDWQIVVQNVSQADAIPRAGNC
jgi:hypothetical protein